MWGTFPLLCDNVIRQTCVFCSPCKDSVWFPVFHFIGWQACYSRLSSSAHFNRTGPSRTEVVSASSPVFHLLRLLPQPLLCHPVILIAFFFFLLSLLSARYLVLFNPIEQERLCAVTVLVNTVRVRVLTEDGQTLPVQLSAQWSSASQMSAEVFEVRG